VKAFLLAAGLGTRLRPLTDTIPKCLLEVGGRPLLGIWLDEMARAGVDEVLVNLHHHADAVREYLASPTAGPKVVEFFEPKLLGSAGTLLANRAWVADEPFFLAANADNLTDFDLTRLIEAQRSHDLPATLTLFASDRPTEVGIIEVDDSGLIVAFEEKPAQPKGVMANGGIYAFAPIVLDWLEGEGPHDIGFHLLPKLIGRAHAIPVNGYFRDIGNPERYAAAQREWRS